MLWTFQLFWLVYFPFWGGWIYYEHPQWWRANIQTTKAGRTTGVHKSIWDLVSWSGFPPKNQKTTNTCFKRDRTYLFFVLQWFTWGFLKICWRIHDYMMDTVLTGQIFLKWTQIFEKSTKIRHRHAILPQLWLFIINRVYIGCCLLNRVSIFCVHWGFRKKYSFSGVTSQMNYHFLTRQVF